MRGKACLKNWNKRCPRITPAYAGKRHVCNAPCKGMGDHPRVCGEKDAEMAVLSQEMGSPPRMRGKAVMPSTRMSAARITPAYAGKSILPHLFDCAGWDHPRVCGEKFFNVSSVWSLTGSPPRMRGKGLQNLSRPCWYGITPAYAGKRLLRQLRHITSRDHPRVCGEKSGRRGLRVRQWGSPPRMRGKESLTFHSPPFAGITPAYAGKRIPPLSSMLFA